jgi:hypothetical protein
MKLDTFSRLVKSQEIESIKLHRNPDNLNHWFPMIHCTDGTVHLLIDETGKEISKSSLEKLIEKLKHYGAKKAEILF